jgi:hypothetical protein
MTERKKWYSPRRFPTCGRDDCDVECCCGAAFACGDAGRARPKRWTGATLATLLAPVRTTTNARLEAERARAAALDSAADFR